MAAVDLLAGTVMDKSASLLNDTAKTVYTYTAQVPYLQMAIQEMREHFELHNVPVTENVSATINIPAGTSSIVYNGLAPIPALPNDMVEPLKLWERSENTNPFIPMTRCDFLPHNLEGILVSQFIYFVWQSQAISFLPSNRDNDIKIDYIRELFSPIVDQTSIINCVNGASFLEFRTAALCAEFIERNMTSANSLNMYAGLAIDRVTGIGVKGKQTIMTRRKPFRAGYKLRGWVG